MHRVQIENELMVAGGGSSWGVWEGHVHTIFKMDNQQLET